MMAALAAGKFVNALCTLRSTTGRLNLGPTQSCTLLQTRNYAARKGTRERARKKKVKVAVEKVEFTPHRERGITNVILPLDKVRLDDSWKQDQPEDDVWIGKYYKWKIYPFEEAIQCAKEIHSPEMFDVPNALVKAIIELDMTGPKPSKPVTKFSRIVTAPHMFDHGENRTVAAFCKTPEMQEDAKKAGATIVGGQELVASIQTGDVAVASFDYVVAHPDMMAELVIIKGLLKKKFPMASSGSIGGNIPRMIHKFLHGIKYNGHPHEQQSLYGLAEASFGRLDMETKQLQDNFAAVIDDIMAFRPKRAGPFITRLRLTSLPSKDVYKVDHTLYVKDSEKTDDDDDEEEVDKKSVAAAS